MHKFPFVCRTRNTIPCFLFYQNHCFYWRITTQTHTLQANKEISVEVYCKQTNSEKTIVLITIPDFQQSC